MRVLEVVRQIHARPIAVSPRQAIVSALEDIQILCAHATSESAPLLSRIHELAEQVIQSLNARH